MWFRRRENRSRTFAKDTVGPQKGRRDNGESEKCVNMGRDGKIETRKESNESHDGHRIRARGRCWCVRGMMWWGGKVKCRLRP